MPVKKTYSLLWLFVVCIALLLLALPRVIGSRVTTQASRPSGIKHNISPTVRVTAIVATPRPLARTLTVPGAIIANERVQLKAEANGRITALRLREGVAARKGELLVKINDADLTAQLAKARATLTLIRDRQGRAKTLFEKKLISQEEYDLSSKELAAAEADSSLLAALIEKTEIRAPFDGTVGLRLVSEGDFLSVGTPVADFVKTTPTKVEFSVPERYAGMVPIGARLTFTVQGSTFPYTAHVYARQPALDQATRTLRVRALCREESADLLPGAFAEIRLDIGRDRLAIMVPSEAIVADIVGQTVFIIKNGKAVKRQIQVADRTDSTVQVASGLTAGDTIITSGIQMIKPGVPVTVTTLGP